MNLLLLLLDKKKTQQQRTARNSNNFASVRATTTDNGVRCVTIIYLWFYISRKQRNVTGIVIVTTTDGR